VAFERDDLRHGTTDIYVFDRTIRAASLVTAGTGGGRSNNQPTEIDGFDPNDSNRLLFSSAASNLVTNDANTQEDVFVRNLSAGVTRLVSVTGAATSSGGGTSTQARWVGDGTKIAFVSQGSQFGPTDTNGDYDVYVRDETARTYTLVSLNAAGTNAGNRGSGQIDLSPEIFLVLRELSVTADGSRIAFGSDASDLGPTDSTRSAPHDVYVARFVTPS
jgi:hypothetical protein